MLQKVDSADAAERIFELLLNEYGKKIFTDKNPNNVRRCFNLIRIKLQDILNTHGQRPTVDALRRELTCTRNQTLPQLSEAQLRRFVEFAKIGRCALIEQHADPEFFVTQEMLSLATRLLREDIIESA